MRSSVADRGPNVEFNISVYSEADRLYRAGRFRDALRLFKASFDADSSDGDALFALGSRYRLQGTQAGLGEDRQGDLAGEWSAVGYVLCWRGARYPS
jgi:hypothetical protein